jgi:hypothetical protein
MPGGRRSAATAHRGPETAGAPWALGRFLDAPDDPSAGARVEASAVDATSFAIMRRTRIRLAYTFDHHFTVAGFRLVA